MNEWIAWLTIYGIILVEVIVGIILYFFTPKWNKHVGFRTKTTLSSETKWNYGNKLYGKICLILAFFEVIILTPIVVIFLKKHYITVVLSCALGEAALLVLTIVYAEIKTFVKKI